MQSAQVWLVTGANGSGKDAFLSALAGTLRIVPNENACGIAAQASCAPLHCGTLMQSNTLLERAQSGSTLLQNGMPQSEQNLAKNACGAQYSSAFGNSVELVSLERAALLIQEERENDESDYIKGGVDIGRTGRVFIAEAIAKQSVNQQKKRAELYEIARRIESFPEIKLCGIENILDRGLKYMSTGEIRRTLLARALVSGKKLLILSDPFAGLDSESRSILQTFFNTIATRQLTSAASEQFPRIILGMERYHEIPDAVSHVLEFCESAVSFCGARNEYEMLLAKRASCRNTTRDADKAARVRRISDLHHAAQLARPADNASLKHVGGNARLVRSNDDHALGTNAARQNASSKDSAETTTTSNKTALVEMHNVTVGWGERRVLVNLNWSLHEGEHWLIRGPNGSGKTTFLELITGDNMQAYCNDVRMFGKRRGTGETIWDIKAQLGIVSYRLHVEYRMVASTSLLNVLVSGFKDSIGLYERPTDAEITAARKWLAFGGFAERERELFSSISYGEQRALLILRAVVKCPPILVLDEPCHALDENYRQKILDLLETIAESGATTLLHVTHETDEMLACEKHILELRPNETPMYKIITR